MNPVDKRHRASLQISQLPRGLNFNREPREFVAASQRVAVKVNPYDQLVKDFQQKNEGLRLIEERKKLLAETRANVAACEQATSEIEDGLDVLHRRQA